MLDEAQLQGAQLFGADRRGASLNGTWLQAASLQWAQFQGAVLEGARLQASDLSNASLWRTNIATPWPGYIPQPEAIRVSDSTEMWRPVWNANGKQTRAWNEKAYRKLTETMVSLPSGDLRDAALKRIARLDCENSSLSLASCDDALAPPEPAASWRTLIEQAKVDDAAYAKARAAALRAVVCTGRDSGATYFTRGNLTYPSVENSLYVLRGLMSVGIFGYARIGETHKEASGLIDFILSKDCPVSALLTDDDKGKLLVIKQEATKRTGG